LRKVIVKLRDEGKTLREIGGIVCRTHSSVQRVLENFNVSGSCESKRRSGRPPKLTEREKRSVLKTVKINPRTTASQIAKDIKEKYNKDLHSDTVCKILKKPLISQVNKIKRMEFSRKFNNKPQEFWKKVIFSDESKFCIFGIKGRTTVWRKTGTALEIQNLVPTVKHGGDGVMVWGCMAASGVGNLVFIESTMDHKMYINILKENLHQSATTLGLEDDFWFQQDNDPKHCAINTKLWLLYNVKNQLNSPPQSLDLNPIEHLWDLLKRRIRQHTITSKDMLKQVMVEEWNKISMPFAKNMEFS